VRTPPRILVADDTPANVRMLETRLRHEGYEVVVARDGEEALDDAFSASGATPDGATSFSYPETETIDYILDQMKRRSPSFTWTVSDEALDAAIGIARSWALERHGRLDVPLEERFEVRWHRYRLGP
jgi:CheY-like chemotaxis protein